MMTVIGPTRPINIKTIMIMRPTVDNLVVMSIDTPTVARALVASKKESKRTQMRLKL